MQTYIQAAQNPARQNGTVQTKPTNAELQAAPQGIYRGAAQLMQMQAMMVASPQQQRLQVLQAKMVAGMRPHQYRHLRSGVDGMAALQRVQDEPDAGALLPSQFNAQTAQLQMSAESHPDNLGRAPAGGGPVFQLAIMTRSRYEAYLSGVMESFNTKQKTPKWLIEVIQDVMEGCDDFDKQRMYDDVADKHGIGVEGSEDDEGDLQDVSETDHDGGGNEEIAPDSLLYNQLTQLKRAGNKESAEKTFATSSHGQYKKVAYKTDGLGNINFSVPTKQTQWSDPVDGGTLVDLSHGSGVKGKDYGKMAGGNLVKIRGASRGQHFSIANRIMNNGAGSSSPANWTWHHLTTYPKMVLVDRAVHAKYGHNGGILLW